MPTDVVIETKHTDHPREQQVVQTLHQLAERYPLPWFSKHVRVAYYEKPHSHPVLTLNTRETDWRCVLRTFVHEQMHWFKDGNPAWNRAEAFFKTQYSAPDLSEFNIDMSETREKSFLLHIIVCWNTENYLRTHLSPEDLAHIEQACSDPYAKLNMMIQDQFEQIGRELEEFDMVAHI